MIDNINEKERKNYQIFLDNAAIHALELFETHSDKKLKVVFNVLYLSFFNMAELGFRAIKRVIYNYMLSSIEEVESKIIETLESEKFRKQWPLLFKEAIREYIKCIEENFFFNLNFS